MYTNFVELLFNNLLELLPFKIIRVYQRGIKFTFGHPYTFTGWLKVRKGETIQPKQLEPGFHWVFPLIQDIQILSVVPEVINLPTQTVTCQDDSNISFSANIEYRVVDAVKMFCEVQDFDQSLINIAMNKLSTYIRAQTYAEIYDCQDDIEAQIATDLTQKTMEWGVEVISVGITDLTKTRSYRIFSDYPIKF